MQDNNLTSKQSKAVNTFFENNDLETICWVLDTLFERSLISGKTEDCEVAYSHLQDVNAIKDLLTELEPVETKKTRLENELKIISNQTKINL